MFKVSLHNIISLSVALYLIGLAAVKYYLSDINMLHITQEQSEILWQLGVVRDIGFWGFCFFAVVSPLNNFLSKRKNKHLIFVAIAITGNLVFIGFTLYNSSQLANIPPMTGQLFKGKPEILTEYREFLNPEHEDLKEHSKITKMMASAFFQDNGVIVEVVEENGELVKYKPSPENVKMRQEMLQADALIIHQAEAIKSAGNIHTLLLISAIFFGFMSPWILNKYKQTRIE
ncbi:hypothetical protein KO505_11030 [Psychrosphaera sp. F3M07]|uniref:hypothetical protein n=1 Tax=Psychrosphaera sp. F3M07 TaxID=2841560 RepID=UPI001C07FD3C|nr:hypothetical protein [Psychrosphaera sp. F3M07]MBU2918489.1 hypothetical protein [Psychrosphaera sp. F3M07]